MRKIVYAILVCLLIASSVFAASISLDLITDQGGGNLREDGTFSLAQGETLTSITGVAIQVGTLRIFQAPANVTLPPVTTWTATIQVPLGTYDCLGQMNYVDANNKPHSKVSNSIQGTLR
jgi:hypothetical protein